MSNKNNKFDENIYQDRYGNKQKDEETIKNRNKIFSSASCNILNFSGIEKYKQGCRHFYEKEIV